MKTKARFHPITADIFSIRTDIGDIDFWWDYKIKFCDRSLCYFTHNLFAANRDSLKLYVEGKRNAYLELKKEEILFKRFK